MRYAAHSSRSLIAVSVLVTGLSLAVAVGLSTRLPGEVRLLGLLPLAVVGVCALFTVRGYRLRERHVLVERLLWTTELDLSELESAEWAPEAVAKSLRLLGNGGLFSFSGLFWNRELGRYRAWMTNRTDAVVLRFPDRTWVVSPNPPEAFLAEVVRQVPAARARARSDA